MCACVRAYVRTCHACVMRVRVCLCTCFVYLNANGCVYVFECVHVCVCVRDRERQREGVRKGFRTTEKGKGGVVGGGRGKSS